MLSRFNAMGRFTSSGIVFVASRLHEQLMAPAVLAAVAARPSGPEAAGPRTRILVITAGFGDIAEVVRAIKTHPNVAVRAGVQIASASCCVDPGNCFWEESRTFPNLLEQCAEGWCSTVMLTGESGSLKQLKTAEALVRAVRQHGHYLGPALTFIAALCARARRIICSTSRPCLSGAIWRACDQSDGEMHACTMVCPIRAFRPTPAPL